MTCVIKKLSYFGLTAVLSLLFVSGAFAQTEPATQPVQSATPAPIEPHDSRYQGRYRFGYNDQIEVEVYKHPELSAKVDVDQNGTIRLPRINEPITAVCKTERQLADDITEKYSKYLRQPYVSVRSGEQKSQSFMVIGAVSRAGAFFVNRRLRLLEVLAMAGGPNQFAGAKVLVARTGSYSVCDKDNANLDEIASSGDPDQILLTYNLKDVQSNKNNPWLQPGDVVSVLEAEVAYVVGNVNRPKTLNLKEPITLSEAIAAAEGLKPSSKKGSVRILRKRPDAVEREVIVCDLNAIEKMKAPDPVLQPNDIVAVSNDPLKSLTSDIIRALTNGIGYLPYYIKF